MIHKKFKLKHNQNCEKNLWWHRNSQVNVKRSNPFDIAFFIEYVDGMKNGAKFIQFQTDLQQNIEFMLKFIIIKI